jgi:hypothetical protein
MKKNLCYVTFYGLKVYKMELTLKIIKKEGYCEIVGPKETMSVDNIDSLHSYVKDLIDSELQKEEEKNKLDAILSKEDLWKDNILPLMHISNTLMEALKDNHEFDKIKHDFHMHLQCLIYKTRPIKK